MMLASEWITHLTNEDAWDQIDELVTGEPDRAWRIIRAVINSAPDYGVLSAIAAGPVEDLISRHGDTFMPILLEDAKNSARVRICLRATYSDLPSELRALIEAETADVRDVPVDQAARLEGEDLALVISWLHHSDTSWASEFLKEMTENDPAAAWDVLRVLAVFAEEDARIRDDVYEDAFAPFIRSHLHDYYDRLVALGHKSVAFRQWVTDRKRPLIEDAEKWVTFIRELASA